MKHALLVLLAACGAPATSNTLNAPASPIAGIGAPHVSLFVKNLGGLHRVWLDTAKVEHVDDSTDATPLTAGAYVVREHDQLVLVRTGQPRVVLDDVDATNPLAIAPDGKQFAIEQERDEIAVVSVADAQVRKVPLEPRRRYLHLPITFSKDGASLLIADEGNDRYRVDIATGARTPIDALEWKVQAPPAASECPAHGLRIERRTAKNKQELVLVTLASARDPEQLSSLSDRVLVSATNHPRLPEIEVAMMTPSCEHFVFALDDRIYVANIATGRYALLMRGTPMTVR